jgi:hypothetical protein
MRRMTHLTSMMALVALGCGGQEKGTSTGTSTDAGTSPADGGTASEGGSAVPLKHRPAAVSCTSQRAPGPPTQPYPPGQASRLAPDAGGCTSDSDCTSGLNGRCFPFEGLVGPGGCSYDDCTTDSNCGSKAACLCRSSSSDNSANVCDRGGSCAVDSDCGPGGYCSPSGETCAGLTYRCHTAQDACTNDSDCPSIDADAGGSPCITGAGCAYSPQAQHWVCSQLTCCPP